jgi:hypothetical protein
MNNTIIELASIRLRAPKTCLQPERARAIAMEPFKEFLSAAVVDQLAEHLALRLPQFDRAGFTGPLLDRLDRLELKARAQMIADQLDLALPKDADERGRLLLAMLLEHQESPSPVRGWAIWPLTLLVGQHGLADFSGSMALLREMTKWFTAEFAVRYFLIADQDRALSIMHGWIADPNPEVRRLVSEGSRPRLPWAMQLPRLRVDAGPVLPLLHALRDDAPESVRRSVANHLKQFFVSARAGGLAPTA